MTTPLPPEAPETPPPPYIKGEDFTQVYAQELARWVKPASQLRTRRRFEELTPSPTAANGLVGLALSGGGIRSATFALGACQAMARSDVLEQVDYLSTVSGGGFFGSAVSSLLHGQTLQAGPAPSAAPSDESASAHPLARQHFPFRFGTEETSVRQFKAERAPVRRLREMSNYLAPRLGLLDTQTWYAVFRTLTMSVVAIVTFALPPIVLLLVGLTYLPTGWWDRENPFKTPGAMGAPLTLALLSAGVFALSLIPKLEGWPNVGLVRRVLLFPPLLVTLWIGFCLLVSLAWAPAMGWRGDWTRPTGTGGLATLALIPAVRWAFTRLGDLDEALSAAGQGTIKGWLSKSAPKLAMGLMGYAVLAILLVVIYTLLHESAVAPWRPAIAAAFAVPLALGVFTNRLTPLVNGTSLHAFYRDRLSTAYIQREVWAPVSATISGPHTADATTLTVAAASHPVRSGDLIRIGAEQLTVTDIAGPRWMVTRGANGTTAEPIADNAPIARLRLETAKGADERLHALQAQGGIRLGPYHLVNTALNISGSTDVEELGRKSDSFTLASFYSGSPRTGYAATTSDGLNHLTLGAAMAISGAAVSPNQGTATTTSLSILLTLLNARLGYWLRNPLVAGTAVKVGKANASPFVLYWKEMFGKASSRDLGVYLSDGGHFDNSGIYELVRRRCKYIIAVDGSGEPSPSEVRFPTIGIVSRLVRIDFGVDIKIDLEPVTPDASGTTPDTHALGRILYPAAYEGQPEADRTGLLLYIRATLTKDVDSPDLNHYKRMNPIFPNHSTADQFFDEAQFEAYRALGYNIARGIFRQPLTALESAELQPLCHSWNATVATPPAS